MPQKPNAQRQKKDKKRQNPCSVATAGVFIF
jgi:hypothetical protein